MGPAGRTWIRLQRCVRACGGGVGCQAMRPRLCPIPEPSFAKRSRSWACTPDGQGSWRWHCMPRHCLKWQTSSRAGTGRRTQAVARGRGPSWGAGRMQSTPDPGHLHNVFAECKRVQGACNICLLVSGRCTPIQDWGTGLGHSAWPGAGPCVLPMMTPTLPPVFEKAGSPPTHRTRPTICNPAVQHPRPSPELS